MSSDFGMLPNHLQSIVRTAPIRYKVFYIPKRSGGLREVAQPAREVKAIQRWLMAHFGPLLPLHEAATAYRPGASIKNNALRHVDSDYLLKMDFRNFFPSILMTDIIRHLKIHCGQQYDASAIKLIAYVCTWAPGRQGPLRLCIGAPSSPLLSNSVMFDFDTQLSSVAAADGVRYTRYADDLALSVCRSGALKNYPSLVSKIVADLKYPQLKLNEGKTVFASRAGRRVVTGVTLTADHQLSIGRTRKREIRAMYHRMVLGKLSAEEQRELAGLIAFADDIEPGFAAWLSSPKKL
nr:retron St85 family RNA-directed DNA polymerase [Variovorax sp. YR750]